MMSSLRRACVFVGLVVAVVLVLPVLAGCKSGASIRPVGLTCEYRRDPVGIGATMPRLGWVLEATHEGATDLSQSGYRIIAASSEAELRAGAGHFLWDSGVVRGEAGASTFGIEYAGRALGSRSAVCWRVMVFDQNGEASEWSDAAAFSIGLLERSEWKGEWIGMDAAPSAPLTADVREMLRKRPWIRQPGGPAREAREACFRAEFDVPAGEIERAFIAGGADQIGVVSINGAEAARLTRWDMLEAIDVTPRVKSGRNAIGIHVEHHDGFGPAVSGALFVRMRGGQEIVVPFDEHFALGAARVAGWDTVGFDGSAWAKVEVSGSQPWGGNRNTEHYLPPVSNLRTVFEIAPGREVTRATLYSTALGVYNVHVNGARVGADELAPGWTEYSKRVYHQTHDVTAMLAKGRNSLAVELGDGWYASMLGFTGRRYFYGGAPRFIGQLEIEYADGTREVVASSREWKVAPSAWEHADLYMGAAADMRKMSAAWMGVGYDDAAWKRASVGLAAARVARVADVTARVASAMNGNGGLLLVSPLALGDPAYGVVKSLTVEYEAGGVAHAVTLREGETLKLPRAGESAPVRVVRASFGEASSAPVEPAIEPQPGEAVRRHEEIRAIGMTQPRRGRFVFDLGQNMVGWARVRVRGHAGQRVVLRYAEMLNPDGTMYTSNLRGATATDFFTLRDGEQVLEPLFTFHGFQYVEITGVDECPTLGDVVGIVVHSEMEPAGEFECSSALVNQLVHNIEWGQKGNYVDIPTDCPQRDERFGWTGDAQFFANAAAYNFDIASFMSRWLKTLSQDSQFEDGTFADVAPKVSLHGGSTAWGDAAIVCAHAMYRVYGDERVIRENYGAFTRYMAWLDTRTSGGIAKVGGYGDWLNLGDPTSSDLIDTAYRAELLRLMSEMAGIVGNAADRAMFDGKREETVKAFSARFLAEDGSLRESGQTGYALVFSMPGLLPESSRAATAGHFRGAIARKSDHLATGFIGTPRLLPALFAAQQDSAAGVLLLNEDYPSWLYQVKLGATTMWERWDGWTPERGFSDVGMNSFNHYAFGSVGDALYGYVAGITPLTPGYGRVRIAPRPVAGLDHVRAVYRSVRGRIGCEYARAGAGMSYTITVPPNVTAEIELRGGPGGAVLIAKTVGSGTWRFTVAAN